MKSESPSSRDLPTVAEHSLSATERWRRTNHVGGLLTVLAWLVLVAFAVAPALWPIVHSAMDSKGWSEFDGSIGRSGSLILVTLSLVIAVLFVALPFACALAIVLFRHRFFGRRIILWLLATFAFMPLVFHGGGWRACIGPAGFLSPITSDEYPVRYMMAVLIHVSLAIPWLTLLLGSALRSIDPRFEEQALLDAPPLTVLRSISFPMIRPVLLFGCMVATAPIFNDMTACDLYRIRSFAEEAYTETELSLRTPFVTLLSSALSFVVALGLARAYLATSRISFAASREAILFPIRREGLGVVFVATLGFAVVVLPMIGTVWQVGISVVPEMETETLKQAYDWSASTAWQSMVQAVEATKSTLLASLLVSIAAATLSVSAAVPVAWTSRFLGNRGKLFGLAMITWLFVMPGPLLGTTISEILYRDWLFDLPRSLTNGSFIVILTIAIKMFPLTVVVLSSAFSSIDLRLLESASLESQSPLAIVLRLIVPFCWKAIAVALLMGMAQALCELAVTQIVMPPGLNLLGPWIFHLLHTGTGNQQAALAMLVFCMVGALCLAAFFLIESIRFQIRKN